MTVLAGMGEEFVPNFFSQIHTYFYRRARVHRDVRNRVTFACQLNYRCADAVYEIDELEIEN